MPPLRLLDLPDDALLAVLLQLPLPDRLRAAETCRRLRGVTAGPSALWRTVAATSRRLRRGPEQSRQELGTVAMALLSQFAR